MLLDCPICLDFYSERPEGDYWISTDCGLPENGGTRVGHVFHYNCLVSNVNHGSQMSNRLLCCPMCRQNIDLNDITRLHNIDVEPKPNENVFDHELKVAILGKYKAGKSSIIKRFARNVFDENYTITEGIDFFTKFVKMGDKRIKLKLWDTAGQERHRGLVGQYVRNAFGLIFTYDITDRSTFDAIQDWIHFADDHGPVNTKRILVGNKLDLGDQREVSFEEGQDLAKLLNLNFLECSAKESYNIPEIFRTLTAEMLGTQPLLIEADAVTHNILLQAELNKLNALQRFRLACC